LKIQFLGTAAAIPSLARNVSALGLRLEQRREWWLFDCGEGTQHRLLRTDLPISQVRRIFLSHMHGDHLYGLPGLMATRGFKGGFEPLDVYGPPGIREFIEKVRSLSGTHFSYPLTITEIPANRGASLIFEDDEYIVHAVQVPHVGVTFSFVIEEKQRAGRFRIEQAQALGLRPGPLFGKLKAGETITLEDGRVIDGRTLVDPPLKGRKLALVFDTSDASGIVELARDADLLVHESTYLESDIDPQQTQDYGHSTAAGAGRLAKKLGAKKLALSHFSLRYEQPDPGLPSIKDLIAEAEREFTPGAVVAAADFMPIEIPRS